MELGMIGLGRMGGAMAHRLLSGGHSLAAYDVREGALRSLEAAGAKRAESIPDLVDKLDMPRTIWIMVPAGEDTESAVDALSARLSPGDILVDGGNSYYRDTLRRAGKLREKGLSLVDVGTSGGISGAEHGYSLMVAGENEAFRKMEPLLRTLASPHGAYGYVGPSGAGHFVKMVHNGIEYGMMEAYAEGFELIQAKGEFQLDLAEIARIWCSGSVVRSWLLQLIAAELKENPGLDGILAYVEDSGEGRWTVQESLDLAVPIPVITESLQARFRSRQEQPFGARLVSALRNRFGGHPVKEQ
jgi:6-phosphogluconate dehydrogenase